MERQREVSRVTQTRRGQDGQRDGYDTEYHDATRAAHALPNGQRVSGERGAEGDERVRCTRMLGGHESKRWAPCW